MSLHGSWVSCWHRLALIVLLLQVLLLGVEIRGWECATVLGWGLIETGWNVGILNCHTLGIFRLRLIVLDHSSDLKSTIRLLLVLNVDIRFATPGKHIFHCVDFVLASSYKVQAIVMQIELFWHSEVVDDCSIAMSCKKYAHFSNFVIGKTDACIWASFLELNSVDLANLLTIFLS